MWGRSVLAISLTVVQAEWEPGWDGGEASSTLEAATQRDLEVTNLEMPHTLWGALVAPSPPPTRLVPHPHTITSQPEGGHGLCPVHHEEHPLSIYRTRFWTRCHSLQQSYPLTFFNHSLGRKWAASGHMIHTTTEWGRGAQWEGLTQPTCPGRLPGRGTPGWLVTI